MSIVADDLQIADSRCRNPALTDAARPEEDKEP